MSENDRETVQLPGGFGRKAPPPSEKLGGVRVRCAALSAATTQGKLLMCLASPAAFQPNMWKGPSYSKFPAPGLSAVTTAVTKRKNSEKCRPQAKGSCSAPPLLEIASSGDEEGPAESRLLYDEHRLMPSYEMVVVVKPAGPFGLPQEGLIIHPGGELYGPTLDTHSGNIVAHGTLSRYREQPVSVEVSLDTVKLRLRDDYLTVTFSAEDDQSSFRQGMVIVTRFCLMLSAFQARYYHPEFLQLLNADTHQRVKIPTRVGLFSATFYDTGTLSKDAARASRALTNQTMEKAAAYFSHALFLMETPLPQGHPSFHDYHIRSQVVLNFYKAISTIIGEPGIDRDAQSRYQQFRIPAELWREAEEVRELRNNFDIAHYTPDWKPMEELMAAQHKAQGVAHRVILLYEEWLIEQQKMASAGKVE